MSVVTVALNDLAGIKRTFASLHLQTYTRIQHVVIDGGSKDGTAEWASKFPVSDDTTVTSEPDTGIYDAMNKGLAAATGDLVAFLNCGDEYADGSILELVARDYAERNWQWAYGFGRIVDLDGRRVARGRVRQNHSWRRNTFWDYEICHPAVFMRTAFARELGGFDATLRIAADYKLTTAAGMATAPRVLPVLMTNQVEGGISDTSPSQSLLETHLARVELLGMGRVRAALDRVWTVVMLARSRTRRRGGQAMRELQKRAASLTGTSLSDSRGE